MVRTVAYSQETQSVVVLLTPRIIVNPEQEVLSTGSLPPIPRP
jgi:hypothetical protein